MYQSEEDFQLSSYRFDLPEEQIAQFPPEVRGDSRLMVMSRKGTEPLIHTQFKDLKQ